MNPSKQPPTLERVVESIARTTRYPVDLLNPSADLEDDLGIDSVKRLEIVVGLSQEFGLALESEAPDPTIRTIEHVANWITSFLPQEETVRMVHAAESGFVPSPKSLPGHAPQRAASSRVAGTEFRYESAAPAQALPPSAFTESSPAPPAVSETQKTPVTGLPYSPEWTDSLASQAAPVARAQSVPSALPLQGKIALVTGSGRGVGRVIARSLASKGATVIVNSFHSRNDGEQTAADINAAGGSAIHVWGSVANTEHVDHIFSEIEQRFGRLDMLICNASDGRIGSFMELTEEDWGRAFRTNVSGHHQCAVRAASLMRAAGGGSIVTMSSVGANAYIEGLGSQGVVKAAVETMTRYLACELGQFGIRVNCVAGGPVYGDLLSKFSNSPATQNHWESITADGELCSPMDLANAIAFLVSQEASGITGSVWMVDHGFSAIADGRPRRFASRNSVGTTL